MRTALCLVCLSFVSPASAAFIDFSQGELGDLNTSSVFVQGVKVESVAGGFLYRWNQFEGCDGACIPHGDYGFGIRRTIEDIDAAQPELNEGEFMRLTKPFGTTWGSVHFSSVNDLGKGLIYQGVYPAGPVMAFNAFNADAAFQFVWNVPLPYQNVATLWITAKDFLLLPGHDTYFLVHGVTLNTPGTPDQQSADPVPEPTTIALLGTGLLLTAYRRRQRRVENSAGTRPMPPMAR